MRKLIETLIRYGYLKREIQELVILSCKPETTVYKFSNNEFSVIAKNIRDYQAENAQLKLRITELQKQLQNENNQ